MSIKRAFVSGAITLVLFLLLIIIKVTVYSQSEYQKGKDALYKKDSAQAIMHFNRAIHWYSPGNKAVKSAIEALWHIGIQAEEQGDETGALRAFRALRSSLSSARSFYTPYSDWIEKCDDRIASILARQESAGSDNDRSALGDRKAKILKILKTTTEPNVLWSLILEIGLVGWIGCTIGFIVRVFTGEKGFNPKRALFWGGLIIFFYAFWIVGMLNA